MGWPIDTAPPLAFTISGFKSNFFILAMATTEKASLISHKATSSFSTPVDCNSLGMTRAGAIVKSIGAVAASANPVGEILVLVSRRLWLDE